ncbi:unnamed protein product [Amoebophrya sp. A25]|nr:unnamed protein product [Amoebophrya sp. A25]|eukprot:GSA25T00022001001.1
MDELPDERSSAFSSQGNKDKSSRSKRPGPAKEDLLAKWQAATAARGRFIHAVKATEEAEHALTTRQDALLSRMEGMGLEDEDTLPRERVLLDFDELFAEPEEYEDVKPIVKAADFFPKFEVDEEPTEEFQRFLRARTIESTEPISFEDWLRQRDANAEADIQAKAKAQAQAELEAEQLATGQENGYLHLKFPNKAVPMTSEAKKDEMLRFLYKQICIEG